jgi:uncharacterized membrane protein
MTLPATEAAPYAKPPRIGLVDTARGAALIAMATYHFSWDLEFMGYLQPGTAETGWLKIYARAIAATFLFIVGVSLVLASRPDIRWPSFWKRFGMIAAAAVLISAATAYLVPGEWIYFGILHSIAVLSLIGVVFLRLPLPLTLLVTLALLVGWIADIFVMPGVLGSHLFDPKYLAWLGFAATPDRSNDFVPLFPWATPFFLGMSLARLAFRTNLPHRLAALGTGGTWLARLGRHSPIRSRPICASATRPARSNRVKRSAAASASARSSSCRRSSSSRCFRQVRSKPTMRGSWRLPASAAPKSSPSCSPSPNSDQAMIRW